MMSDDAFETEVLSALPATGLELGPIMASTALALQRLPYSGPYRAGTASAIGVYGLVREPKARGSS